MLVTPGTVREDVIWSEETQDKLELAGVMRSALNSGWPGSGPSSGIESSPPPSCQWDFCLCCEGVKASFEPWEDHVTFSTVQGFAARVIHCEDKTGSLQHKTMVPIEEI